MSDNKSIDSGRLERLQGYVCNLTDTNYSCEQEVEKIAAEAPSGSEETFYEWLEMGLENVMVSVEQEKARHSIRGTAIAETERIVRERNKPDSKQLMIGGRVYNRFQDFVEYAKEMARHGTSPHETQLPPLPAELMSTSDSTTNEIARLYTEAMQFFPRDRWNDTALQNKVLTSIKQQPAEMLNNAVVVGASEDRQGNIILSIQKVPDSLFEGVTDEAARIELIRLFGEAWRLYAANRDNPAQLYETHSNTLAKKLVESLKGAGLNLNSAPALSEYKVVRVNTDNNNAPTDVVIKRFSSGVPAGLLRLAGSNPFIRLELANLWKQATSLRKPASGEEAYLANSIARGIQQLGIRNLRMMFIEGVEGEGESITAKLGLVPPALFDQGIIGAKPLGQDVEGALKILYAEALAKARSSNLVQTEADMEALARAVATAAATAMGNGDSPTRLKNLSALKIQGVSKDNDGKLIVKADVQADGQKSPIALTVAYTTAFRPDGTRMHSLEVSASYKKEWGKHGLVVQGGINGSTAHLEAVRDGSSTGTTREASTSSDFSRLLVNIGYELDLSGDSLEKGSRLTIRGGYVAVVGEADSDIIPAITRARAFTNGEVGLGVSASTVIRPLSWLTLKAQEVFTAASSPGLDPSKFDSGDGWTSGNTSNGNDVSVTAEVGGEVGSGVTLSGAVTYHNGHNITRGLTIHDVNLAARLGVGPVTLNAGFGYATAANAPGSAYDSQQLLKAGAELAVTAYDKDGYKVIPSVGFAWTSLNQSKSIPSSAQPFYPQGLTIPPGEGRDITGWDMAARLSIKTPYITITPSFLLRRDDNGFTPGGGVTITVGNAGE